MIGLVRFSSCAHHWPGEWDALGLLMCFNSGPRGSILSDHVDCDRVSIESQRKIRVVTRSTVNIVQVMRCTTPRVTIHTVCNVCSPLEFFSVQPMQPYAVTPKL